MTGEHPELDEKAVNHYRNILVVHGRVEGTDRCAVCGAYPCADFIEAFDRLATANQLMTEPGDIPPGAPRGRAERLR